MLGWVIGWIWWFSWRIAVSIGCLLTIQNVIQQEGYHVEFQTLMITGACAILGIRIWMPFSKEKSRNYDD